MIVAKLKVFGQKREVIHAEVMYYRMVNTKTGRAGAIPIGDFIYLSLYSGYEDDVLLRWITHTEEEELCKLTAGELSFYKDSFDNQRLFTYKFNDAALVEYREVFTSQGEHPMTISLVISPAIQEHKGQKLIKHWQQSYIPPSRQQPYRQVEEEVKAGIVQVDWVDQNKNNCVEIKYAKKVAVQALLENTEGGDVKVTITKKDGSVFENNKKEIVFSKAATEGMIEFPFFEIKQSWEDQKNVDVEELIAKVDYKGMSKKSGVLEIIPNPKVIVDFRPSKSYDGEYGFDWIRDKKEKKDQLTYKDILGTNKSIKNVTTGRITNQFTKYTGDTKYNDLKDTHYKTITFPWHKDSKGNAMAYIQTWLAMYPQQKVTLSLQLDTIENPKKLDLTLEYDKTFFKLSTDTIPAQSKGKKRLKDHVEIECLKEFDTDQKIKVMYDKRQLGQLNVLKNSKKNRYKTNVAFIEVETDLKGKGKSIKGNSLGKQSVLEKYLKQGLIKPNIVVIPLDLTADKTFNKLFAGTGKGYIDNRKGLHAYLNKKMNIKYKDYLKIYFIPDECPLLDKTGKKTNSRVNGQAKAIGSDAVVVFDGHNKATTTHEALHALGIRHTFDNRASYGYKKGETYNIMDYSHQPQYGSKKRILIWLWQWKILWKNKLITKE